MTEFYETNKIIRILSKILRKSKYSTWHFLNDHFGHKLDWNKVNEKFPNRLWFNRRGSLIFGVSLETNTLIIIDGGKCKRFKKTWLVCQYHLDEFDPKTFHIEYDAKSDYKRNYIRF